jgi:hypothetical protein
MIHGYAAYKWKSALLATPQPALPEIASIATLLKGRKNGPFQGPTFRVTASQLAVMQNAPPGIQQVHSSWAMALYRASVFTGLLHKCTWLSQWLSTSHTFDNRQKVHECQNFNQEICPIHFYFGQGCFTIWMLWGTNPCNCYMVSLIWY